MELYIRAKKAEDLWNIYFSNLEYFRNREVPIKKFGDELHTTLYLSMGYDEDCMPYLTLRNDRTVIAACECLFFEEFESNLKKFLDTKRYCIVA